MKVCRPSMQFIMLIFALFAMPLAVIAQDGLGDANITTTLIIPDGGLYTGFLDNGEDTDVFSFDAISGLTYILKITHIENGCDTYITLFESDGETIIAADDDSGDGLASRIEWVADSSGVYYVSVEPFAASTIGAYEISISESGNSFSHAGLAGMCAYCERDSDCASNDCRYFFLLGSRCCPGKGLECKCPLFDLDYEFDLSDNDEPTCFIATVAYGSSTANEVTILRHFRDELLLTNSLGKNLVEIYYKVSPSVANLIDRHGIIRKVVRWGLLPLVGVSWLALKIGPAITLVLIFSLLSLISAAIFVFYRKVRLRREKMGTA